MKQFYVFILFAFVSYLGFSQTYFQIELVDPQVGEPVFVGNTESVTTSTDDGLNAIFNNYNTSFYETIYPGVLNGFYVDGIPLYARLICYGCNENQLLTDLLAYSDVVAYVGIETDFTIVNGLFVALADETLGVPTSTNNDNVIVTNDSGLNQIFTTYNVVSFQLSDESSNTQYYDLKCRCNAEALKTELDNYSAVITSASLVNYAMLLSVDEVTQLETEIYPNPFKDKITIKTNQPVENVVLYDILGKQIYKSNSILDFENFSLSLKSGVYLLKLITEDRKVSNKKIVKIDG